MNNNKTLEELIKIVAGLAETQPDGSLTISFGNAPATTDDDASVPEADEQVTDQNITSDEAVDSEDNNVYEMVAERLNDVMDELKAVQADFYTLIKTRSYRNVAFNVPKCVDHLFVVLDCVNRMEKLMNRVGLISNTLIAMQEIVDENAPDKINEMLAQTAFEFNKTYTLVEPQNSLMQSKLSCVFYDE